MVASRAVGRVLLGGVLLALALTAISARAQQCDYVVEGTQWLWHTDPPPSGWADLATPDDPAATTWMLGCAPFSNTGCGFAPGTYWQDYTSIWLRKHVWLTGLETGLVASVAVDNDFELFVNGVLVGSLFKEGCATRWDAVIPVPDALWFPGDNVVAVHAIDRGGIANFELTLTGPSPGTCPFSCAQLACLAPGPSIVSPDILGCAGSYVWIEASASWPYRCLSGFVFRFINADDLSILRDWSSWTSIAVLIGEASGVIIEARCGEALTCPSGSLTVNLAALPYPPADPGPVLRVSKSGGLAKLTWAAAPPLQVGEHDHVVLARWPWTAFARVNPEADLSRTWVDPAPFGRACYLVRVADSCEIESIDD